MTHGSPQLSQQTPRMEMILSSQDPWESLLFNGVNPQDARETHKVFENVLSVETLPAWVERNRWD